MTRDRLGLVVARELINRCAVQFRIYAEDHTTKAQKAMADGDAKRAAESAVKSRVNEKYAEECEKFLEASAYINDGSEV